MKAINMRQAASGSPARDKVEKPGVADRAFRRAFFFRRMRGRRDDPVALRDLWNYRPDGHWTGDALLTDIPYAVVGGVATRMYMPERTTADIDILVEPENFDRAISQLIATGYERKKQPLEFSDTRLGLIGQRLVSSRPVDILSSNQSWIHDAVASIRWENETLPIVDLPYLVALKLDASRSVDQGDLSRMLGFASEEDLNRVRSVIARLLPADVDDLEQYILLGRFEVGKTKIIVSRSRALTRRTSVVPGMIADPDNDRSQRMDEDQFNLTVRKFLKEVGVTSQREIEKAVRDALSAGRLRGSETLDAKMTLRVDAIGLSHEIDGHVKLS